MAAVKSEARRRRAVATCYPGAAEEARGPGAGARTVILVVQVAILLYLRTGGTQMTVQAGVIAVRVAQAPVTSCRGGEGDSGLGPWETRRAAPRRGMCVCAEEAAASGGRWEEGLRRTKKLCR